MLKCLDKFASILGDVRKKLAEINAILSSGIEVRIVESSTKGSIGRVTKGEFKGIVVVFKKFIPVTEYKLRDSRKPGRKYMLATR